VTVPSAVEAQYQAGRGSQREALLFTMRDGSRYGFTSHPAFFTWNGDTYQPNSLITIEAPQFQTGMAALPFTIRLPATDGITPGALESIESLPYRRARVQGWVLFYNSQTGVFAASIGVLDGFVDTVSHEMDGDTAVIVASCETRALALHKTIYRLYSPESQARVRAGDTSMDGLAAGRSFLEKFGKS
jgi:hypothetical protein